MTIKTKDKEVEISRNSRDLILSFIERSMPRLASGLIMVLCAALLSPDIVGLYSTVLLAIMGLQAVFDGPVKQVAVPFLSQRPGPSFLRSYSIFYSIFGSISIALVLWLMAYANSEDNRNILLLTPIVLSPMFMAWQARPLASLQRNGRWKELTTLQLWVVVLSFAVSLPILLWDQSILGPALQLASADVLFTIAILWKSRNLPAQSSDLEPTSSPLHQFAAVSVFSVLGWIQNQSDRLLILILAGPSLLAQYTLSWSLARNISDAATGGTLNVLRPKLSDIDIDDHRRFRMVQDNTLMFAVFGVFSIGMITILLGTWLLPEIVGPEWASSIRAMSIMSVGSVPALVESSLVTAMIVSRITRRALPVRIGGLLCVIPIALAATHDIALAAWFIVARQILTWTVNSIFNTKLVPRRVSVLAIITTFVLGLTTIAASNLA